jgi:hypothetical protein
MNMRNSDLAENLRRTLEITELTKALAVAAIINDNPSLGEREAESLFWARVREAKNISLGMGIE